ncbi:MarR family winged helix-turn-helix transcriptional regulator [Euzebya rosea]|uniref:MarR family winged helix-turn-helix transcriptional regulator n=1 Tax=Euzebya rosea TaxID=2052804 RepID=UPI000D3E4D4B|nr:MarR family transcriptional regulator [Euzebya rosea]
MTDTRWLSPDELQAWRWLSALLLVLPGQLEDTLRPHGLSFFEYSIMAGLSSSPDRTRPMSELAQVANGSLSRLSHAARRLESRGWLQRCRSTEDGRVTLATLTDEGQRHLVAAAPDHVESVRQAVFDVLEPGQVQQMRDIASAIVDNVVPGVGAAWGEA